MKTECADYTKNYHAAWYIIGKVCIMVNIYLNLFEFPCSAYSFGFFT